MAAERGRKVNVRLFHDDDAATTKSKFCFVAAKGREEVAVPAAGHCNICVAIANHTFDLWSSANNSK